MKIDVHTHTKRCKSGDAPTREISPSDFCERVLSTEVKIVAITNHNVFDLDQYQQIQSGLSDEAQAWPGIELDILENEQRGHLLVIVSPSRAKDFSVAVRQLTGESSPDSFAATIDQVLERFEPLRPLYVAHYGHKKPNLSEGALEKLVRGSKRPQCVIHEVTNSISAGIYISHGHPSIYGSDVHDWAEYEALSQDLPDLRLPVDSFEHFCLLLEKDPTTINTALNRKTSEELTLQPFEDESFLKLQVFNDINIVFGAKGTGKSCILQAIATYYSENGIDAKVYEPGSDRLHEIFDLKGKDLTVNLQPYSINYCSDEIEFIRGAKESSVTGLGRYVAYFESKSTNRNAKRILLKNIEPEQEGTAHRTFTDAIDAQGKTAGFLAFVGSNPSVRAELTGPEHAELTRLLTELLARLRIRVWNSFSSWKEITLLNSAIESFRREVERKTGDPAKPATTGFRDYAKNRMAIELKAGAIIKSLDAALPPQTEVIGTLGANKGALELRTEFAFQNGYVVDGELASLARVKKTTQKNFANRMREIRRRAYADDLFQSIARLNEIEDIEEVKTVYELVQFKKFFALDGLPYRPSSGEASMVMLQKELARDGDIYILDEPERSLGNEYISDVIVPLIKERARAGKKVFISTHDANIAVRTLPYCSIYRSHDQAGYRTYVGNPFSNHLVNSQDANDRLDWRKVSMRTLEGGEAAFGERGTIYGHS